MEQRIEEGDLVTSEKVLEVVMDATASMQLTEDLNYWELIWLMYLYTNLTSAKPRKLSHSVFLRCRYSIAESQPCMQRHLKIYIPLLLLQDWNVLIMPPQTHQFKVYLPKQWRSKRCGTEDENCICTCSYIFIYRWEKGQVTVHVQCGIEVDVLSY